MFDYVPRYSVSYISSLLQSTIPSGECDVKTTDVSDVLPNSHLS